MASDSNSAPLLGAFIAGALIGAGAAILYAPMKGQDLRTLLKKKFSEHSIILSDVEVDEMIARLELDNEDEYV